MPRFEIQSGVVEQDGERHEPGETIRVDSGSVAHLREHTTVALTRIDAGEGDTDGGGADDLTRLPDIGDSRADDLRDAGLGSFAAIADSFIGDVAAIDGISEEHAPDLIAEAGSLTNPDENDTGPESAG